MVDTPDEVLQTLRGDGRAVICYFSAGSFEAFRDDVADLPADVKGAPLDPPFEDELWLDIRAAAVRDLVSRRLDIAVARGCDAVEPDNVDAFANDSGFPLTAEDQLAFNRFIASEAHRRGLSVGLKNDLDQLDALVDDFDWALNEECFAFDECDGWADTFVAAGKAVFHAEYVSFDRLEEVCAVTAPLGLSTILKDLALTAPLAACP